ncbi:hypothetical protein BpHYR1_054488 [Brachionus plicatilis]|uniref:Uncharacterized protein n=1 Tax=Brachionus plicatilis TaxID=10195 RepID=A0A3M7S7H1_BRAPC|nr:hypothetical protein BpHYR1_054488 [Brachionus plicatilis]
MHQLLQFTEHVLITRYFMSNNVLGTVQTAIDAAKNFLNRETDRLDGRPNQRRMTKFAIKPYQRKKFPREDLYLIFVVFKNDISTNNKINIQAFNVKHFPKTNFCVAVIRTAWNSGKISLNNKDFNLSQKYENYKTNFFIMTIIQSPDLHLTSDFNTNLLDLDFNLGLINNSEIRVRVRWYCDIPYKTYNA